MPYVAGSPSCMVTSERSTRSARVPVTGPPPAATARMAATSTGPTKAATSTNNSRCASVSKPTDHSTTSSSERWCPARRPPVRTPNGSSSASRSPRSPSPGTRAAASSSTNGRPSSRPTMSATMSVLGRRHGVLRDDRRDAVEEQPRRVALGERREDVDVLVVGAQRHAAGQQDVDRGRAGETLDDRGEIVGEVLAVVEHDEQTSSGDRIGDAGPAAPRRVPRSTATRWRSPPGRRRRRPVNRPRPRRRRRRTGHGPRRRRGAPAGSCRLLPARRRRRPGPRRAARRRVADRVRGR